MSSKGEGFRGRTFRQCGLAVAILGVSVWCGSGAARAQDLAAAGPGISEHVTQSLLEQPRSEKTPYLVIGMAERSNLAPYDSLPMAGSEPTREPGTDAMMPQVGSGSSTNRNDKGESEPMVLSSLSDIRAEPAIPHGTIQSLPHPGNTDVFSLLVGRSVSEAFLYSSPTNYLAPEQALAEREFPTVEAEQAPSPLLQLGFGAWTFPVMLSGAGVSR